MTTDEPTPAPASEPDSIPVSGPPTEAPAATRPAWLLPAATGVVGLVLGAAITGGVMSANAAAGDRAEASASASAQAAADASAQARRAVLTDAYRACNGSASGGLSLGDDGTSLTFDMRGDEDSSGASMDDIACVFAQLDVPSAVLSHVEQTTSMDGRQTETWDDLTASWSYHPDRGLDGVLTVGDE